MSLIDWIVLQVEGMSRYLQLFLSIRPEFDLEFDLI